jgi:hypothetical protein
MEATSHGHPQSFEVAVTVVHELSHGRRCRLGFFSRSSSELLLEVVDEDGEIACSASEQSNGRDGLVAGWPKTSWRGKQE